MRLERWTVGLRDDLLRPGQNNSQLSDLEFEKDLTY